MRGFLGGVSAGALLAAGGLAMLSLSVPMPVPGSEEEPGERASQGLQPAPQPAAHDPGGVPEMPNGGSDTADVPESSQVRDADLAEAQPTAPAEARETDDLAALAGADTTPASRPQVGLDSAAETGGDPETGSAPGISSANIQSNLQAVEPAAPEAPAVENAVVASTEPAPEPEEEIEDTETSAESEVPPAPSAPEVSQLPEASAVQAPDIGTAPQATTLPVIGPAPDVPAAEDSDTGGPGEAGSASEKPDEDGQGVLTPSIGTRVVPLTERDKSAPTDQLSAVQPGASPFAANAVPFDLPEGRPLMSIVLIDGIGAVGAEALTEFPYPLSFAIDPEDPEAAAKAAARRQAGFEVLLMADLPRQASPQDAETALEVWRGKLPEAVAILEGVETGVQGNRPLADQVAAMAASAGYGLVTQNSGLNTVQKLAVRDGVPAGFVFRDFDGAGQDPRAIRRFLDQAAFRAGQEGSVIMLGRLRPDTISALLIWGLQDRADRVTLAPVSASLKAQLLE